VERIPSFGGRLKELRATAKVTQRELAARIRVSQQQVSAWERGKERPRASVFPRLAQALDTTIDDLVLLAYGETAQEASEARQEAAFARSDLDRALKEVKRFVDTYQAFHAAYETMGRQIDPLVADVAEIKRTLGGRRAAGRR
jgi:transcriptional regulator with XRE-family HTH domain